MSAPLSEVHLRLFDSVIIVHVITAAFCLILGGLLLVRPKGSQTHRELGRVWAASMILTCLSSLLIPAHQWPLLHIAGLIWGPIHGLTFISLLSVVGAIVAIQRGSVRTHRRLMVNGYLGLAIAGLFTLVPGRALHAWAKTLMVAIPLTPAWVGLLFLALFAWGIWQSRARTLSIRRAMAAPAILLIVVLASSVSLVGFAWTLLCILPIAAVLAWLLPQGERWSAAGQGQVSHRSGIEPLLMILTVFAVKYAVGVSIALGHPPALSMVVVLQTVLAAIPLRSLLTLAAFLPRVTSVAAQWRLH